MPRVSGGPGPQLGVQGVAIKAVPDYQAEIRQLKRSLDVPNPNPQLLVELNKLATQIQDEDDKNLDQGKKKKFQTVLDNLERDTILKLIKREHNYILTLFQSAQPMTHEKLTPEDKRSLQELILRFAPEILNEELDLMYPPREAESNSKKAVKLAELLSIYMNLLERLLPTFFGADPDAEPNMLFIPNTTRNEQGEFENREEALMVDLAMRAVYQYMVQIKTIGQSASAIADAVVPRTPADFIAKFATFGLTMATLKAISPTLFRLIRGIATGAGLSVDDIRLIMTEAFSNAGYISAFLLWCNQNRKQITGLSWKIFSNTLGRGMPEAPGAPPNDFKTLFDNLSDITMEAHRVKRIGEWPEFRFDLLRGLDCVAYLVRSVCYTQADMLATAVSKVPRALQYLSKTCGRLAQRGAEALSSSAVQFESRADAVSLDTYESFSDLLSQLAGNAKYASLHANADFRRCMELMQLNNPNPHSLNAARLQASVAQHHQQFGGPLLDSRVQAASTVATTGGEYSQDLTITPEHVSADQMEYDPTAAGGFGASTGEMLPPNNVTSAVETPEGMQHSDEVRDLLDDKYRAAESTVPTGSDDEGDNMGNVGAGASASGRRGGRSRSRKSSVSKRTRRKGVDKKQKSNKNKRQSRRKVRRASSRRSRK